jgi:hypothetical protein
MRHSAFAGSNFCYISGVRARHPTRRRLLKALALVVTGAPIAAALGVRLRRRTKHPTDLPPIPWIGHC